MFFMFPPPTHTKTHTRKEEKQKSAKYQMISTRSGQRNRAAWGTKCENRKPDRSVQIGYKKRKHPRIFTHICTHICTALGRGIITRQWTLPDTHMIYICKYIYIYAFTIWVRILFYCLFYEPSNKIYICTIYYVDCRIGYTIFVQSLFVFTFAPFYNLNLAISSVGIFYFLF